MACGSKSTCLLFLTMNSSGRPYWKSSIQHRTADTSVSTGLCRMCSVCTGGQDCWNKSSIGSSTVKSAKETKVRTRKPLVLHIPCPYLKTHGKASQLFFSLRFLCLCLVLLSFWCVL